MINTIILDLDGTLLNCQMRHYQCYFNILVEHGYVPMTMDSYWLLKRNRSDLEHLLGRSNATVFRDQFKELWLEQIECRQYLKLDQVYPLVMETLCNWKSLGIRLILSTLRNHETDLSWQLQSHNLTRFFDQIVVQSSSIMLPDKAQRILPLIEAICPDSILWIGDTEADIEAAQKIGCCSWALTCGIRNERILSSFKPDFLSDSLAQVNLSIIGSAKV